MAFSYTVKKRPCQKANFLQAAGLVLRLGNRGKGNPDEEKGESKKRSVRPSDAGRGGPGSGSTCLSALYGN